MFETFSVGCEDISVVHVLGDRTIPTDTSKTLFTRASKGSLLLDLSAEQLSSPFSLRDEVLPDIAESTNICWIDGQQLAHLIGDESREAYVEWLAKTADQNTYGKKSLKELFTYNNVISLWWFTGVSRKHPSQTYRWLFYQIFAIRHIASEYVENEARWHIWAPDWKTARVLRDAVPDAAETELHVSAPKDLSWKNQLKRGLLQCRIGEILLTLRNGLLGVARSLWNLYHECKRFPHFFSKSKNWSLDPERRSKPLILVHTLFPDSWTGVKDSGRFRGDIDHYDRYFGDFPWRLEESGYAVGWLPSPSAEEAEEWKQAHENHPLPDAAPWMKFTWQNGLNVIYHRVKWILLYLWLFVFRRIHEQWTYDGIRMGEWVKESYRGGWRTDAFVEVEKYRSACRALQPEAIVYRNEFYPIAGRRITVAAKELTSLVGVQHGMINREHTVYQWDSRDIESPVRTRTPDYVNHAPTPDWFAAFGSYYVDQFRAWGGYPADNVLPIGSLRHDILIDRFGLAGDGCVERRKKRELRNELGLPEDRTIILLCTGQPRQAGEWFRIVVRALRREGLEGFVAVKTHPSHPSSEDYVRSVASDYDFHSFKVYGQRVYSLMAAADILIGSGSTTILEANLFGLYTIALCASANYEVYPFSEDSLAEVVTDASEMATALHKGAEKSKPECFPPTLKTHLQNTDGGACQRFVGELEQQVFEEKTLPISQDS